MNRKDFLKTCAQATCASLALPLLQTSCKTAAYVPHSLQGEKMVVKKSELTSRSFVVFKPANLPAPVYLTQFENGEYSAVLLRCTHKGCEVRPAGKELNCPCHGSVFSQTGEVLESPAQAPLQRFRVTSDDQNIFIF
ncbi:MAG: Rieske (2Fe-2S) protein [Bacteroidota bacterium]